MTKAETKARSAEPVDRRAGLSPSQRSWFGYASLFLIFAILAGFWIFSENLITTIESQAVEIRSLREEARQQEELLSVLHAPRIEIVTMSGSKTDTFYGKILWDPANKVAIFQASNLPTIAEDKDYQLWIFKNKKPRPAGLFAVRDEKASKNFFKVLGVDVSTRKDVDAFAVTLEPKGGQARPSGPTYLFGSVR